MKQPKRMGRSKSAADISQSTHNVIISPEDAYKLSTRQNEWGIEGYEVPANYYDYHQIKWWEQRKKILDGHRRQWPPKGWPTNKATGKQEMPKRPHYLDDIFKWCNSFYNPKRAKELISNGVNVKDYQKKSNIDTKRRNDYLEKEKKKLDWQKERANYLPSYKADGIDAVKEKIKADSKAKEITYETKMKNKYIKGREEMPRCDRVTIVSDAEFVGEQIPFYNTPPDEEGGSGKKKKLFYPDKTCTWERAPAWKYLLPSNLKNDAEKMKEDLHKEKVQEYLDSKGLKKEDLMENMSKTFYNVTHHGNIFYKINPRFEYENVDQYKTYAENFPKKNVGPQHYWQMPQVKNEQQLKKILSSTEDSQGNKVYYMDRRKTDKRVYISGMRKSVY